jgi:hypothetical protein
MFRVIAYRLHVFLPRVIAAMHSFRVGYIGLAVEDSILRGSKKLIENSNPAALIVEAHGLGCAVEGWP